MMRNSKTRDSRSKEPPSSQGEAFIDLARALGCDESEERFNEALKKVARHKAPPTDASKRQKAKK